MNELVLVLPVSFKFAEGDVVINCVRPVRLRHPVIPGAKFRLFSEEQQEDAVVKAENIFVNHDCTTFLYFDYDDTYSIELWAYLVELAHFDRWVPCVFLPGIKDSMGAVYAMTYDDIVDGYTKAMNGPLAGSEQGADEDDNEGALFAELGRRVWSGEFGKHHLIGMEGNDVFY